MSQVRRVKYDEVKTRARKRQIPKIAHRIRADLDIALRVKLMSRYLPIVAKLDMRILLVKPKHLAPAARVQYWFHRITSTIRRLDFRDIAHLRDVTKMARRHRARERLNLARPERLDSRMTRRQ